MRRSLSFCTLVALAACAGTAGAGDDGPSDQVPELKVLDHYIGSWDVKFAEIDRPFTKGEATAKWTLDGRFLQQSSVAQAKDGSIVFKMTMLMTYDTEKKRYRIWMFLSDGSTSESEGTWNAKTKTLTTVGRKDAFGNIATTTAEFSEAGVEKWKIVVADQTGRTVSEMTGKNTRRPK